MVEWLYQKHPIFKIKQKDYKNKFNTQFVEKNIKKQWVMTGMYTSIKYLLFY